MNRRILYLSFLALIIATLSPYRLSAQEHMAHHHPEQAAQQAVPSDPHQAEMEARVDRLIELLRTTGSLATTVLPKDPNFVPAPTAQSRTFTVIMHAFAFSWDGGAFTNGQVITVNQGDTITINVSVPSSDPQLTGSGHSFVMENYVPSSNLLGKGESQTFGPFVASQAGDFFFFCGQPTCGSGHGSMFGTFRVTAAAPSPTISGLSPSSGPAAGGTAVTITGTNFVSGTTVSFGGVSAASTTFNSSSSITAVTPQQAVGTVDVTVRNPDGSSVTFTGFTYVAAAPVISSVSPASGPMAGGTTVTITGSGFQNGASVTFGGLSATSVVVASASTITATTPAHPTGDQPDLAVDVRVANPDGQSATKTSAFTYQAPASVLGMTGIAPSIGSSVGGTPVRIVGSGFTGGVSVTIGGVAATNVVVVDDGTATAVTGAHATGSVDVVVTKGSNTVKLTKGFVYVAPGTVSRRRAAKH
jgi:heme/copper-type cytochrome/quinol oxidase subunit 2